MLYIRVNKNNKIFPVLSFTNGVRVWVGLDCEWHIKTNEPADKSLIENRIADFKEVLTGLQAIQPDVLSNEIK